MAEREVFYVDANNNLKKAIVNFKWENGFTKPQKQKSVTNLHSAFKKQFPDSNILEASTVSKYSIGFNASAFILTLKSTHGTYTVEQLFQSGKVFQKAGSQIASLNLPPRDAKRNSAAINQNDKLIGFDLYGMKFPLTPKTIFYDWLYLNALLQHPNEAEEILKYNAFTDINANPQKTINSQAKSCAIFVSLRQKYRQDELKQLLKFSNLAQFQSVVYHH